MSTICSLSRERLDDNFPTCVSFHFRLRFVSLYIFYVQSLGAIQVNLKHEDLTQPIHIPFWYRSSRAIANVSVVLL